MHNRNRSAFTIVELLVVVTIIVILLALLTPAMDRAIYQAELAVCATNLKSVASGAQTYAIAFQRHYPYRQNPWLAERIAASAVDDLRITTEGYMHWKQWIDPLTPGPFELSFERAAPTASPMSNYTLRFGYRYVNHKGMLRLGDRLEWTDDGQPQQFSVIASDRDRIGRNGFATSTHNDASNGLVVFLDQDGASGVTLSRWEVIGTHLRDKLELNYGFTDGSVVRYDEILVNDTLDADSHDERFGRVPERNDNAGAGGDWNNLPYR